VFPKLFFWHRGDPKINFHVTRSPYLRKWYKDTVGSAWRSIQCCQMPEKFRRYIEDQPSTAKYPKNSGDIPRINPVLPNAWKIPAIYQGSTQCCQMPEKFRRYIEDQPSVAKCLKIPAIYRGSTQFCHMPEKFRRYIEVYLRNFMRYVNIRIYFFHGFPRST